MPRAKRITLLARRVARRSLLESGQRSVELADAHDHDGQAQHSDEDEAQITHARGKDILRKHEAELHNSMASTVPCPVKLPMVPAEHVIVMLYV
jgi:hypothetical protein